MEEKQENKHIDNDISTNQDDVYVPSQLDRKKASFMYILLWIFIYLSKKQYLNEQFVENKYISFHLRQSIWIRTIIFVSFPVLLFFSFIPVFRYIVSFLLFLFEVLILLYFAKMAWDWKYLQQTKKSEFMFFYKLWDWVLSLFD